MKTIKTLLITAVVLLYSTAATAHDFYVDGIYYNITDATTKTVEVTYKGGSYSEYDNEYTGSVVIPSTVTYNNAAYSVTSIGSGAFSGCTSLTSITIPNSVTSIGDYAFSGTAWYNNQPDGLVYAGKVLYKYKGTMPQNTSITIKEGTLGIGNSAFEDCPGLTGELIIPNSVTSIGDNAFPSCPGLTSITIGNSVRSIGEWAFSDCPGLTSITIPNSVTSIGSGAFSGCSGLTGVTIGNSVTSIGIYAFSGCSGLKEVHINDLAAWCKIDFSNYYSNPLYYAHNLYLNGEKVTNFVIPDGVTEIKRYAFEGCTALTSIEIPNSVTSIGSSAFEGSTGLTSITIPNSVTSIGSSAFKDCTGLKEVHINDLAAWCKIDFEVEFSNPLYYAHNLYLNGEKVTNFVIPDGVTEIKHYAFNGCSGLTNIEIPNSVTSIGRSAFEGCSGLTSITIPNSVTTIGFYAFYGCTGLTGVTIGSGVTSIGGSAFSGCSGLTSITIPNSVTSIRDYAFYGCSGLTSIEIPNSVTSIGRSAFEDCTGLTEIYSLAETPATITYYTFNNYSATLYVPAGAKEEYQAAYFWKNFTNIVEMDYTDIDEIEADDSFNGLCDTYYDLKGSVVENPAKGIYISDGKKVYVK